MNFNLWFRIGRYMCLDVRCIIWQTIGTWIRQEQKLRIQVVSVVWLQFKFKGKIRITMRWKWRRKVKELRQFQIKIRIVCSCLLLISKNSICLNENKIICSTTEKKTDHIPKNLIHNTKSLKKTWSKYCQYSFP